MPDRKKLGGGIAVLTMTLVAVGCSDGGSSASIASSIRPTVEVPGVFITDASGIQLAVWGEPEDHRSLISVAPNPFSSSCAIRFELPEMASVRVWVEPLLGRGEEAPGSGFVRTGGAALIAPPAANASLRTLVDGVRPAGQHLVSWDARDNGGNPVPSGFYRIHLSHGGAAPIAGTAGSVAFFDVFVARKCADTAILGLSLDCG